MTMTTLRIFLLILYMCAMVFSGTEVSSACSLKDTLPQDYFDEQLSCIVAAQLSAPGKIQKGEPVIADCHPAELTRQQCSGAGGSFCTVGIQAIITIPESKDEDFRAKAEACIPRGCPANDLAELQKYWNDKLAKLISCKSSAECPNAQFTAITCASAPGTTTNGLGIFIAVVVLLVAILVGATTFYVYKKRQSNPEIPIEDVLRDMPPMKLTKRVFSSAKKGIMEQWNKGNDGGNDSGAKQEEEELYVDSDSDDGKGKPYDGKSFYS